MSRHGKHVQCRLRKGESEMVAWIPEACAIQGRTVDLDDPEHGEALGWTVVEAGTTALDSKWINERSRDYLNQRKVSDL